jgi:hypothetical protein
VRDEASVIGRGREDCFREAYHSGGSVCAHELFVSSRAVQSGICRSELVPRLVS